MFKAIVFRFIAVLISLLIVAFFGELALRIFAAGGGKPIGERNIFCRFDDELGWTPLENINYTDKRSGFVLHQNQFGLRGPDEMQLAKTSARKRILVLGDSYVWGVSASQDDTFTNPAVHGTDQELINCGVPGYGTDQEYLFYLRTGQKFDVDQVVLVFTPYNDVTNNLAREQYSYLKPYFTLDNGELVLHNGHVRDSKVRNVIRRLDQECRVWDMVTKGFQGLGNRPVIWKRSFESEIGPDCDELLDSMRGGTENGRELRTTVLKALYSRANRLHFNSEQ